MKDLLLGLGLTVLLGAVTTLILFWGADMLPRAKHARTREPIRLAGQGPGANSPFDRSKSCGHGQP